MSSYICAPRHFNSIQAKLEELALAPPQAFFWSPAIQKIFPVLKENGPESLSEKAHIIAQTVNHWRRLNALLVSLQYARLHAGTLDHEIQQQTEILLGDLSSKKALTVHGLYNALRCLNYQIEPEHLQGLRDFTTGEQQALDFLSAIIPALAKYIVEQLPDDPTNTWSID